MNVLLTGLKQESSSPYSCYDQIAGQFVDLVLPVADYESIRRMSFMLKELDDIIQNLEDSSPSLIPFVFLRVKQVLLISQKKCLSVEMSA